MRRLLLSVLLVGCASRSAPPRSPAVELDGLVLDAPATWEREQPRSEMRAAQWSVAAVPGDPEDAQVVVHYFGAGGAGDAAANIARWSQQFAAGPDGAAVEPSVETFARGGLTITLVSLAGRYVAPVRPGAGAHHDKPGFRLLAAIVTTASGPYYIRLLGPEATVAAHEAAFRAMLTGARAPK